MGAKSTQKRLADLKIEIACKINKNSIINEKFFTWICYENAKSSLNLIYRKFYSLNRRFTKITGSRRSSRQIYISGTEM